MSTKRIIGAAASATAVVSGSTAIAFVNSNKYGDFYWYSVDGKEKGGKSRKYIGNDLSEIKKLLKELTDIKQYRSALKANLKTMKKTHLTNLTGADVDASKEDSNSKLDAFANYINKWCETLALKSVENSKKSEDEKWDESKFVNNEGTEWKAFNDQCTIGEEQLPALNA
ncbi:hypothetical protein MHSWG343_07270 [Candidatus Mycoplasma haematohominis]|uniref:Uncharacterized protein n=1 Tax=Candidatus Mycoplasma haematohominis TaxID=1494318 RepID=A0A478FRC8_9MOLU|nr:hypothetical protein MHSWG343_07270 [Candidatus Mycoplasma haemohominis]